MKSHETKNMKINTYTKHSSAFHTDLSLDKWLPTVRMAPRISKDPALRSQLGGSARNSQSWWVHSVLISVFFYFFHFFALGITIDIYWLYLLTRKNYQLVFLRFAQDIGPCSVVFFRRPPWWLSRAPRGWARKRREVFSKIPLKGMNPSSKHRS